MANKHFNDRSSDEMVFFTLFDQYTTHNYIIMQRFATNHKYGPKVVARDLNDITLSWKHISKKSINEGDGKYKLQICKEFGEWKTIYW